MVHRGDLYLCTWLFADSEEEASVYFQVPGESSSRAFQDAYWRCVCVFFATSYRHQPGVKHLLFTNVGRVPSVDGVDVGGFLRELGVEVVVRPLTFTTPRSFYHVYRNQFYVFDILHYLDGRLRPEDSAVVLDSDCVFVAGLEPMWAALERDGVLTYVENYPPDWPANGLTREEMSAVASGISGKEVPIPLVYCGGELIAASAHELERIVALADPTWRVLIDRHSRGEQTFREEGQTLSFIYHELRYPLGNATPFIRRISTGSFGTFNNAQPTDHGLLIWHVPLEKRLGIRRLFPLVVQRDSRFWSLPVGAETRRYLGSYLGVPANSKEKLMRDLAKRIADKVRYRWK